MTLARQAGIDVKPDVAERAASYLDKELVEEEIELRCAGLDAARAGGSSRCAKKTAGRQSSQFQAKAFDNLWTNRDKFNAYTRALLALGRA